MQSVYHLAITVNAPHSGLRNKKPKVTAVDRQTYALPSELSALRCEAYHVSHLEVAIGEDNGIWRRGDGQHEGERGTERTRHHDVQRVHPNGLGLHRTQRDR